MSLSLSVLSTLLFLLPGLVFFAAGSMNDEPYTQAAPKTSSLRLLAGIPLLSTFIFTAFAGLVAINDLIVGKGFVLLKNIDINFLKILINKPKNLQLDSTQIAAWMITYTAILIASFYLARKVAKNSVVKFQDIGWLGKMAKEAEDKKLILCAEVVTDHGSEGAVIHFGALQWASFDEAGNFQRVVLRTVTRAAYSKGRALDPLELEQTTMAFVMDKVITINVYITSEANIQTLPQNRYESSSNDLLVLNEDEYEDLEEILASATELEPVPNEKDNKEAKPAAAIQTGITTPSPQKRRGRPPLSDAQKAKNKKEREKAAAAKKALSKTTKAKASVKKPAAAKKPTAKKRSPKPKTK